MFDTLPKAAFLIIGDEILSGRTTDKNLNFLACELTNIGISLQEVRIVPDIESEIINAINALSSKYQYVFTSGGIGPTHDDITSLAIAKAFNAELVLNKEAVDVLIMHYGKENINDARMKMAYIPYGAKLLDNPVTSAPGFRLNNVFVMAGVPKIFQGMFMAAKKELKTGELIKSEEVRINLTESVIAANLSKLQDEYKNIAIGSYPFEGGTSIVFRSIDEMTLKEAVDKFNLMLKKLQK